MFVNVHVTRNLLTQSKKKCIGLPIGAQSIILSNEAHILYGYQNHAR